jgi:hypothetical protein
MNSESQPKELLSKNDSEEMPVNRKLTFSRYVENNDLKATKTHEIENLPSSVYGFKKGNSKLFKDPEKATLSVQPEKVQSSTKINKFQIDNNISYSQVKNKSKKTDEMMISELKKWQTKTLNQNDLKLPVQRTLDKKKFKTKSASNFLINSNYLDKRPRSKHKLYKNNLKKTSKLSTPIKKKNKSPDTINNMSKRKKKKVVLSITSSLKGVNKSMQKFNRKKGIRSTSKKTQLSLAPKSRTQFSLKKNKKLKPISKTIKSKSKKKRKSLQIKSTRIKSSRSTKKGSQTSITKSKKKKIKYAPLTLETVLETKKPHRHKQLRRKKKGSDNHFNKISKLYKNRKSKIVNKIKILNKSPVSKTMKKPNKKKKILPKSVNKTYKKSDTQQTKNKFNKNNKTINKSSKKKIKKNKSKKYY